MNLVQRQRHPVGVALAFCQKVTMNDLPTPPPDPATATTLSGPTRGRRWLTVLHPSKIGRFLWRPWTRYVLCWCLAIVISAVIMYDSWMWWAEPDRVDGNEGHVTIDFGGQWLVARMFIAGQGRHLYSLRDQRPILEESYPQDDAIPNAEVTDVERLLKVLLDGDKIGRENLSGPMYPPVHAMLYAPLGMLSPRQAYRTAQFLSLAAAWLSGWLIGRLSGGRVWWPVAVMVVLLYPGFIGAIRLGQNSAFTLLILMAGWYLLERGHPWWGGLAWGLLAYKPVWAAAFFLAPLWLRRWRFAAAMAFSGTALVAATLPFVGLEAWLDWHALGQIGAYEYTRQKNWIILSGDLISMPRRWLLNFQGGLATNSDWWLPTAMGTAFWLAVPALTTAWVMLKHRRIRGLTGAAPAFVLLGAYFSCYHFIYYDVLASALPLTLLFVNPRRYWLAESWHGPFPDLNVTVPSPRPSPRLPPGTRNTSVTSAIEMTSYQSTPTSPELDKLEVGLGIPPLLLFVRRGKVSALALRSEWWWFLIPPVVLLVLLSPRIAFLLWDHDITSQPWDAFFLLVLWLWSGWEAATDGLSPEPMAVDGS
jgi:hypothetical protein